MPLRLPLLAALLLIIAPCAVRPARAADGESLTAARAELYAAYGEKLAELATWCEAKNLADSARRARQWLPAREPDKRYYYVLDDARSADSQSASAGADEREFEARFQKLRHEQAEALFALARRAAIEHQASLAFELATEAAREDAKLKPAWRLFGYLANGDGWRTPFEIKQSAAGKVWHDKFGWLPKTHVQRYERGERFYRNRWMPAAEEARLRSDIRDGWRVETGHYVVTTNHSLEEGVSLAEQLERLHAIWQQVFAGYVVGEGDLAERLASGEPARTREAAKHNVVYYRAQEEYNQALRAARRAIAVSTLGVYFEGDRKAYFFAGADKHPSTLYHEATHQLFHESRPVATEVGLEGNFWIIEAVACYMESLSEGEDFFTLGGASAGRLPAARQRLLKDGFYMPLEQLVALGMHDLQHHPDIARLYSQSAGLAAFLIDRYPAATVKYLEAVYSGHADRTTLARLTDRSYAQLDAEYRAFLQAAGP
jgi:hypothetical protein